AGRPAPEQRHLAQRPGSPPVQPAELASGLNLVWAFAVYYSVLFPLQKLRALKLCIPQAQPGVALRAKHLLRSRLRPESLGSLRPPGRTLQADFHPAPLPFGRAGGPELGEPNPV